MEIIELWRFQFFRNAVMASVLCGVGCSVIGVFIVNMRIPFIGVAMSHAAMAGAIFATVIGLSPFWCGFGLAVAAALATGPLTDRSRMDPNISLGILFSLTMGLAFLGIGLAPEPKNDLMGLIWGNILLLSGADILRMALVTALSVSFVIVLYKELKAIMFSRLLAAAAGIRERFVYYALLVICGATLTAHLDTVGGLMLFSMIVAPAASAYQLSYRMSTMFILAGIFGVLSAFLGILCSTLFNLPTGACVVIAASAVFGICVAMSPKRAAH